jgi:hypothetical protein
MLVMISGDRLQHAVSRADDALVHGERMTAKLTKSLELLRTRRDELATKLEQAREKECPELPIDWLAML